jgi:photosystem II stability/assembly factor-like uncharacterized protein
MNIIYSFAGLLLCQFLSCNQVADFPWVYKLPDSLESQQRERTGTANVVFRSADGGQTWEDISNGLPEPAEDDYSDGRSVSFLETAGGTVFISSDKGLFKSTDRGETWKRIPAGGLGGKLVESNGVLLTTGSQGVMRSTDDGESWFWVIKEGGVGIDVAEIKGGFAAITYSSATDTRRVRTSYDGGKTWQPIDAGLPAQRSISSIVQVGEYLFCGHPDGIYRSSDKGRTWKLMLPSVDGKVFKLSVSGNLIYAVPRNAGC